MRYIQVEIETNCFPQAELVGTLGYDMIRGNAAYQWEYNGQWLQQHRQTRLSGDLQNAGGPQYASGRLFGFLQDAMPDRWGRRLIDKRCVHRYEKCPKSRPSMRHLRSRIGAFFSLISLR